MENMQEEIKKRVNRTYTLHSGFKGEQRKSDLLSSDFKLEHIDSQKAEKFKKILLSHYACFLKN